MRLVPWQWGLETIVCAVVKLVLQVSSKSACREKHGLDEVGDDESDEEFIEDDLSRRKTRTRIRFEETSEESDLARN